MVNNTLYTGWTDGTFKKQSFDGNTFGAQTTVNVKGAYTGTDVSRLLTADLLNNSTTTANQGRMTSMFYDPRTGRLYFTRAGTTKSTGHGGQQPNNDGGLFYRYFTPESDVVGGTSFSQLRSSSVTAIGADTIRGAFLVGDWLYYVTSAGELRKIQFSAAGAFVGSSQSVNNTADWRAKGLFLSTQPSIQAPNANPTASFTETCVGLSCSFDATASSDTDGTVASYSWNFGDGSPAGSGATPNHVFPSGASYPVTLTVTDNDGGTGQAQHNVTVAPIASQVAFRASGSFSSVQTKYPKWSLPAGIQNGDTIVMAVSGHLSADPGAVLDGAASPTPLPGWNEVADVTDTDTRTVVYAKTATAGDAGRQVGVQWFDATNTNVSVKTFAAMSVYSGVSSVGPVQTAVETSDRNVFVHDTPGITVPDNGDWVLSYWSDKTNGTTDWVGPGSQVVRAEGTSVIGADLTTVRVSGFLTDDGAPTVAGARSGLSATADGKTTAAVMLSLVLQSQ
jgi:PKD repeat protein